MSSLTGYDLTFVSSIYKLRTIILNILEVEVCGAVTCQWLRLISDDISSVFPGRFWVSRGVTSL